MDNYYQLLGVAEDAQEQDIKRAYRSLAKEWHPDKHQGKETLAEADTKFKAISEAYSVLSDPKRRKEYDYTRAYGGSGLGGFKTTGSPFDVFSEEMFRSFKKAARSQNIHTIVGQSVKMNCEITLGESLFGAEKSLQYAVRDACVDCNARGAVKFATCKACKGAGSSNQNLGNMHVKMTCHLCMGSGESATEPCSKCQGQKTSVETRSVSVKVPPGLVSGARLRLTGMGGKGSDGLPNGDLVLEVFVKNTDLSRYTTEEQEILKNLLSRE